MATTRYSQMQTMPLHQTKILIVIAKKSSWCHRCKQDVTPNVIVSGFVSGALSVCPKCHSVIQEKSL